MMSNELMEKNDSVVAEIRPAVTPMDMLSMAMQQGADLDKMQQLMDMQKQWEESEARKAYLVAISAFRAECPVIEKAAAVSFGNTKYKHARLSDAVDVVRPIMARHGLSHSWRTSQQDGAISVSCCVTHVLGHQECTTLSAGSDNSGGKNSIQAIASTVSYLERYTMFAILGLASTEMDDDAKSATIQTISEAQVNKIHAMISDNEMDMGKFMGWLNRTLKCDSIESINVNGYDLVIRTIEQTIKNKATKQ